MPDLPPNFRQDMIEDGAALVNRYIDTSAELAKDFAARWRDGLSQRDVSELGHTVGTEMTALAVGAFESTLRNFRPQGTPPDDEAVGEDRDDRA